MEVLISKKTRKDINKEKVTKAALKFFSEKGIENSKVSEIAESVGLTERSAFRYFETKNDLVLASALYFWNNAVLNINNSLLNENYDNLNGLEKIKIILSKYGDLYHTSKKELIFCDEAETYLNRTEKVALLKRRPPLNLEQSNDPLAKAIREGLKDGSIKNIKEINLIYLNTYDALLGFIQKLSLTDELLSNEDANLRLKLFINSLIKMYE